MMSGKKIRLARIMRAHVPGDIKKTCIVPIDHGTTLGPVRGLENGIETVTRIVEGGADALVLHKGLLGKVNQSPGLAGGRYLLHLSVSTSLGPDPHDKVLVGSVEEGIRLGADGISIHVNLGTAAEARMIQDLGRVSAACMEWGMPLLAMMYSQKDRKDAGQIAHAARLGQELGADIVKVDYPGTVEGTERVVEGVQIPVVIAGGSKLDNPEELLVMVNDALSAGVAGVSIGRNIFQHPDPAFMTKMIGQLVHGELSLQQCLERLPRENK